MSSKLDDPKKNLNIFQHFFYDYGRYHNNIINIIIHVIFVPVITLTLFRLTDFLCKLQFNLDINLGMIIMVIATPIYLYVELYVGFLTAAQYWITDHYLKSVTFNGLYGLTDWQVFLVIHIVAWIIQFIGHGVFEKRKPALMDNIFLTLNAPIFVNLELFYFIFGYRKKELLETKKYIAADIKRYREGKY